mmetsp:Transcript_2508/g.6331  ORF Transcript_2508/g.6331 Transcript_2508/m.6331 type:complete len:264 (+) Transcript_2508:125-916(+)
MRRGARVRSLPLAAARQRVELLTGGCLSFSHGHASALQAGDDDEALDSHRGEQGDDKAQAVAAVALGVADLVHHATDTEHDREHHRRQGEAERRRRVAQQQAWQVLDEVVQAAVGAVVHACRALVLEDDRWQRFGPLVGVHLVQVHVGADVSLSLAVHRRVLESRGVEVDEPRRHRQEDGAEERVVQLEICHVLDLRVERRRVAGVVDDEADAKTDQRGDGRNQHRHTQLCDRLGLGSGDVGAVIAREKRLLGWLVVGHRALV